MKYIVNLIARITVIFHVLPFVIIVSPVIIVTVRSTGEGLPPRWLRVTQDVLVRIRH